MSSLLVTVMDQANPWLILRKILATTIHHQFVAKRIRKGDWEGRDPAEDQDAPSSHPVRQTSGHEVQNPLDQSEGEDKGEKEDERSLFDPEVLPGHDRKDGPFHSDDESHEENLQDLLDELGQIDPDTPGINARSFPVHARSFCPLMKGRTSDRLFRFSVSASI